MLVFSVVADAAGPNGSSIQGTLYDPSAQVVTSSDVDFTIQIFDKNKTCVLYEEAHTGVDLSTTNGAFALPLGEGNSRSNKIDNSSVLSANVFRNDVTSVSVTGCGSPVTFSDGDTRYIRISFTVNPGALTQVGPITLTPDLKLGSSPYAEVASSLNGKADTDFVQVKSGGGLSLTQSNLEFAFSTTNYPRLQAILNGGQTLTNIGTPSAATDAVNKSYADSYIGGKLSDLTGVAPGSGNGKVLTWDSTIGKWVASTPSTGITALTGDVTASGSGSVAASIASSAVTTSKIADNAISSAKINSTYAINRLVITDGTTGANLNYATCASVNQVLKWSLTGWQCGTLSVSEIGSVGTAASKDVGTASGNVVQLSASGLPAVDGAQLTNLNAVRLQSRTVASTSPSSGQVLTWNGSQWEPATPTASSVETVVSAGTCSSNYTINPANGTMITLTLNGGCSISVTGLAAGQSFSVKLTQSGSTTPTFSSTFKWPAGTAPVWSTSAGKVDVLACASFDGSTLQCDGLIDVR